VVGRRQDMGPRPPSIEESVVAQGRKVGRRGVVVKTTRLPFGVRTQDIH
jgi:hypothetical protein